MSMTGAGVWMQAGREFTAAEVEHIRETVAWLPRLDRTELTATLCEHLGWYSASGTPKLQACAKLLEKLQSQALIRLPAWRLEKVRRGAREAPTLSERTDAAAPLRGALRDIAPVRVEPVREPAEEGLWNEYVARYHPLGYKKGFGQRLRYFIRTDAQALGCLFLGGAAKALTVRDQWIGWSTRARLHNLPWVVNNTRFVIFPWVAIPHLASHALGRLARRVRADWQHLWGFSPLLLETFVDPRHFTGTCYRAAGWAVLGHTRGTGLVRPGKTYHTTAKLILVKPLHRHWRQRLCGQALPGRAVR